MIIFALWFSNVSNFWSGNTGLFWDLLHYFDNFPLLGVLLSACLHSFPPVLSINKMSLWKRNNCYYVNGTLLKKAKCSWQSSWYIRPPILCCSKFESCWIAKIYAIKGNLKWEHFMQTSDVHRVIPQPRNLFLEYVLFDHWSNKPTNPAGLFFNFAVNTSERSRGIADGKHFLFEARPVVSCQCLFSPLIYVFCLPK